jgi:hypothetical protein
MLFGPSRGLFDHLLRSSMGFREDLCDGRLFVSLFFATLVYATPSWTMRFLHDLLLPGVRSGLFTGCLALPLCDHFYGAALRARTCEHYRLRS